MLGAVAAIAVLALGNGLDRASARNPDLARFVPGFLAAEAHRSTAATALQAGDKPLATAAAARAVASDPIDPRSTALLGASQLAAGQNVKADRSFRIAAKFGWRDPLTQIYFMNAALNAGQPRLAALRIDAVLRQAPNFPVRDMLLAQFEATPQGRAALAERLALRLADKLARWNDRMARDAGLAECIIAKNRNGATRTVHLHFDGPRMRFANLARDDQ